MASSDGKMSQAEIEAMLASGISGTDQKNPDGSLDVPVEPVMDSKPDSANPAGMMNQDEIAGMRAAMAPEPEPLLTEIKIPEPASVGAGGGMMGQDEIAAMLAAMEAKPEEAAPEPAAAEDTAEEPAVLTEASAAGEAEIAPVPEPQAEVSAAAPEEPLIVPAPPVPPAPAAPGAMMSPEEIDAMMAALNSDLTEESQSMQAPESADGLAALMAEVNAAATEAPAIADTTPAAAEMPSPEDTAEPAVTDSGNADLATPAKVFFLTALLAKLTGIFRKKPVAAAGGEETPASSQSGPLAKIKAKLPFGKKPAAESEEVPGLDVITPQDFQKIIIGLVAALALLLPLAMGVGTYLALTMGRPQVEISQAQIKLASMGIGFYPEEFVKQAGRGNREAINLFIEAGMPPDTYRPADGFTPMMAAASYGKQDIVRVLLGKGANPNVKDRDGQTALMKAVAANQALTVRVLIQSGADIQIKDNKGRTAISIAQEKKDPKVVEFMLDLGVKELEPLWQKIKPAERKAAPRASELNSGSQKTPPSASQGQAPPVNLPAVSSKPASEFGIFTGRVGFAEMGKSVDTLFARYDKNSVTFSEELFAGRLRPVASVYLSGRGAPSFKMNMLLYNQGKDRMIVGIQVYDERFRTESGVSVGATLGDLRQGSGNVSVKYLDDMMVASGKETRIMYELDIAMDSLPADWLKGGDLSTLPDNMRIRSILLF